MLKIKFKCPQCGQRVVIEGTNKKVCPYCGYIKKERPYKQARSIWFRSPFEKILQNKSNILPEQEDIRERLGD